MRCEEAFCGFDQTEPSRHILHDVAWSMVQIDEGITPTSSPPQSAIFTPPCEVGKIRLCFTKPSRAAAPGGGMCLHTLQIDGGMGCQSTTPHSGTSTPRSGAGQGHLTFSCILLHLPTFSLLTVDPADLHLGCCTSLLVTHPDAEAISLLDFTARGLKPEEQQTTGEVSANFQRTRIC